jgi:ABC-type polysaccharide/polyol phosphate export permease
MRHGAWTAVLLREFTLREFRTRYRQSTLDIAWSFVTPIAVMAVYGIVLRTAFGVDGDGIPYYVFAWSGMVMWTFFAGGLGGATPSLIIASDLLAKIYFPREILPLSVVGASCIDLAIGLVTVVVLALIQGTGLGITAMASVFAVVLLLIWTSALAVLAAAVAVFVRDVNHLVQLLLRIGFFATPIMYPVSVLPEQWRWTASVNPVAVSIEALRDTLLRGEWPDWPLLAVQALVGGALLVCGVLYTRSVESRMADVV